jgi:hypothetical protein
MSENVKYTYLLLCLKMWYIFIALSENVIYLLLCLKMWYILIALSENVKYIYYYIWKCDIIQLMTFNEVDTRIY